MKDKYTPDEINILVRQALLFEKQRKFSDAIKIYEELAIQGVDYAKQRLPIVLHRQSSFNFRKVDSFMNIITAVLFAFIIIFISSNLLRNLTSNNRIQSSSTENVVVSNIITEPNIKIGYLKEEEINKKETPYQISVQDKIKTKKLKERVIEAIEMHAYEMKLNDIPYINIKNDKQEYKGYIEVDFGHINNINVFFIPR